MRAITSLRVQAAHFAERSNDLFNQACVAHKEYVYYSDAYNVIKRFVSRHPVWLFSALYILILLVDTLLSSNLIRPIASEILGNNSQLGFIVAATLYAIVILVLTLAASENFYKGSEKYIKLAVELETLQYPDKPLPIIEDEIRQAVKNDRFHGILWAISLFLLTLSLALYRNYIVNDYQLFVFDSPDDWIILILPLLIAVALIYFGQYKGVLQKLWEFSRKQRQKDNQRKTLREDSYREGHKAEELTNQASNRNENSSISKELQICLDRIKNKAFTHDDFFDMAQTFKIDIRLLRNGVPEMNCPVHATTVNGRILYLVTDDKGWTTASWRSEYNYLQTINIRGKMVPGNKFEAGEMVTIDLDDLNGNQPILPPAPLPQIPPTGNGHSPAPVTQPHIVTTSNGQQTSSTANHTSYFSNNNTNIS